MAQTDTQTDGHAKSINESAQWGRFIENIHNYFDKYPILQCSLDHIGVPPLHGSPAAAAEKNGISASICMGREIQYLPHAGHFFYERKIFRIGFFKAHHNNSFSCLDKIMPI